MPRDIPFQVGDKVQSFYRARWHGIVVSWERESYKGKNYYVYEVIAILTHDGRPQRKRQIHTLSSRWLKPSNKEMTLEF